MKRAAALLGLVVAAVAGADEAPKRWDAVLAAFDKPSFGGAWGRGSDLWTVGAAWDPNNTTGVLPTVSVLVHSPDGGQTWERVSGQWGSIDGVWGSGDTIVAVGHGIVRSGDGGKSWTEIPLEKIKGRDGLPNWFSLRAVTGAGDDVWAVGCEVGGYENSSAIVHSADGGRTWAVQQHASQGCPNLIWSFGEKDVVAAGGWVDDDGAYAMVLSTQDGGKRWRRSVLKSIATPLDRIGGKRGELFVTASRLDPPRAIVSRDGGVSWKPSTSKPLLFDSFTWQEGDKTHALDPATGRITR